MQDSTRTDQEEPRAQDPRRARAGALRRSSVTAAGPATAAPSAADRQRVVVGSDGYLFIAQDWTVPCQDRGTAAAAADRLAQVADAVRDSGRDVVVTIAPDKSTVRTGQRRREPRPRWCAREGLRRRAEVRPVGGCRAGPRLPRPAPAAVGSRGRGRRTTGARTPTGRRRRRASTAASSPQRLDPLLPPRLAPAGRDLPPRRRPRAGPAAAGRRDGGGPAPGEPAGHGS